MKGCMTGDVRSAKTRREQGIKPRTRDEKLALALLEYAEKVTSKPKRHKSKKRKKH